MHGPIIRLVYQQASNSQLLERVQGHCCFHVLCPRVPFCSTPSWEKFLHLGTVGCCHLSEVIKGKWPTEKWCDFANLSSAFSCYYFLKKTTIKVKSAVLELFFCGWCGQTMVPTHFAIVNGFISPHEKTGKITAENGVQEKSHGLPVKPSKRTLLLGIIIVLPRLNISLIWLFFSWNTTWVTSNISHWRQTSHVIAIRVTTYRNLPYFSSREKKRCGSKECQQGKKKKQSCDYITLNNMKQWPWSKLSSEIPKISTVKLRTLL